MKREDIFGLSSSIRDHSFSAYAKFLEKLIFLIPLYVRVCVHIRGLETFIFRKILRTYRMKEP